MYSRNKEDDIEEKLKAIGFTLVEDTSRRTQHLGDRLMRSPKGQLVLIDNKSTQNKSSFRLDKNMLMKLHHEAMLASDRHGEYVLPILTVTFYQSKKAYAIVEIQDVDKTISDLFLFDE